MKTSTIIFLEVGMLLGIVMSAFMVPRSTPLLRFGIISGGAFLLGNITLFAQQGSFARNTFSYIPAEFRGRLREWPRMIYPTWTHLAPTRNVLISATFN